MTGCSAACGCSANSCGRRSAVTHDAALPVCSRVARRVEARFSSNPRQPEASASPSVAMPNCISASCISSASRGCGQASSRAASIAPGSRRPRSSARAASPKPRDCTARVRRSSSGASSRKAYGRALSTSAVNGDGPVRSRAVTCTSPASSARNKASQPPTSIASRRQSCRVCATSGWSGTSRSPTMFSRHATWSGNTVAIRSSDFIRCNCGATFLPPTNRGNASAVVAFQRKRAGNSGASSSACTSTCSALDECR